MSSSSARSFDHKLCVAVAPSHVTRAIHQSAFISLPHPALGCARYLTAEDGRILEIQAMQHPDTPASFFVDSFVSADGRLFFMTPVDPLFILLPLLEKYASTDFMCIEDVLSEAAADSGCSDLDVLEFHTRTARHVCEVSKAGDGSEEYKFSRALADTWLMAKTQRLVTALRHTTHVAGANKAKAATFSTGSASNEVASEDERVKAALAIIGDYLTAASRASLYKKYHLSAEAEEKKAKDVAFARQLAFANDPQAAMKRSRSTEQLDVPAKKVKKTRLQAALEKVNTKGMKSLKGFFQPKQ